jgi:hypothetical protein
MTTSGTCTVDNTVWQSRRFAPLSETRRPQLCDQVTRCHLGPVTVILMARFGHILLLDLALRERFGRETAVQPSRRSRASFDLILRSISHALRDRNSIIFVFALDSIKPSIYYFERPRKGVFDRYSDPFISTILYIPWPSYSNNNRIIFRSPYRDAT